MGSDDDLNLGTLLLLDKVCGLVGSIGILLFNGMRPFNINCASPVKR